MANEYTLLGWDISYFTGKVRSYLRYKGVPFRERPITLPEFMVLAPRRTGAAAMPIVVTPEGQWLQDSSVIIDILEQRFAAHSVLPATPVQRLVACLLEIWGDEFWIPVGLHTRWSHPENYPRFEQDAGRGLLPDFPQRLQQRAAAFAANKMRDHLAHVGIVPAQIPALDAWTGAMLDLLEQHFVACPYLLGERASLADFGLIGPLYAHLATDPWPQRELIAKRPQVQAYIHRMMQPPTTYGEFPPDDGLPPTLMPLLTAVLHDMTPWLEGTINEFNRFVVGRPDRRAIPRSLGKISYPLGEQNYSRASMPYMLWMVQRLRDSIGLMAPAAQARARGFLKDREANEWLDVPLPRLARTGLTIRVL
jgi:glutathione S-transferase